MAQWSADVRAKSGRKFSDTTGRRYKAIWERFGRSGADRPAWSEAYETIDPSVNDLGRERFAPSAGRRVIEHGTSETKAELVRELLAEPEVAEKALNTPEARTPGSIAAKAVGNVARATENRYEANRQRTEQKKAADPIARRMDENVALLDLQLAINTFVRKANELLPQVGSVAASERYWLNGETERLEAVTKQVRYLADHGETRTDAELRKITEGA
jgi:hypothetical protein